jgi:hypothetical protein
LTLFDLLLIFSVLATAATLLILLYQAIRRHWAAAGPILAWLGAYWGVYMAVLVTVSLIAPQRVIPARDDRCFDDWCMSVDHVEVSGGVHYAVTLRISSRALRVSQRELDARVQLLDGQGRTYDPRPADDQPPLSTLLPPGGSFETTRVFDLPACARDVVLIRVSGPGPGWFVIGDSGSLLHRRTVMQLQ